MSFRIQTTMTKDTAQVVVSLSGGMDSAVCAALAVRDYGADNSRRAAHQLRTAHRSSRADFVPRHLRGAGHPSPADRARRRSSAPSAARRSPTPASLSPTPPQHIGEEIPVTYVPFRNAHFLSAAVSWAEVLGADRIYIGAVQQDSSGYPDCRPEFYEAFNRSHRRRDEGRPHPNRDAADCLA